MAHLNFCQKTQTDQLQVINNCLLSLYLHVASCIDLTQLQMLLFLQSSYDLVQTAKACVALLTNIEVRHHCHDYVYPKIHRKKNCSEVLKKKF